MNAEEVLDWFAEEIVSGIADSITSATDRSTAAKVEVFHFLLFDVYTRLFTVDILQTSFDTSLNLYDLRLNRTANVTERSICVCY